MNIVKNLEQHTRELSLKETKALKKIKRTRQKQLEGGYRLLHLLLVIIFGAILLYLAMWTRYDLITFILGTFAVFCFVFVIVRPYETFKVFRRGKRMIKKVNDILDAGDVEVTHVKATRIAVAKEFEDEGDLYIVEMENKQILYVWDTDDNLKKGFPCLEFEIYNEAFYDIIGRQINPLTEKIKPIVIDPGAKWRYLEKSGEPVHLSVERKNFDKLVEKISEA